MEDWSSYFDSNGKLLVDLNQCFDDEDNLKNGLYWFLDRNLDKYPASSQAVKLYYAESAAINTHGNYSASILYSRALRGL